MTGASKFDDSSLNDKVLQEPNLNNSLNGVLLGFQQNQIAITSDIEAMFLQVRVDPDHRDAIRFLWWQDNKIGNVPLILRMTVHLFGGVWSPSCWSFVLQLTLMPKLLRLY